MKIASLLALVTLVFAFEASAQRGPRRGGVVVTTTPGHTRFPGTIRPGPGPRHHGGPVVVHPGPVVRHRPGPVVVGPRYNPPGHRRPVVYRTGPVIRVAPRYVYNGYSRRHLRTVVRPPIVWTQPFGYQCNQWEQLTLNGQFIHDFNYLGECAQAIQDIRVYGDFCDGEDLYDQTGIQEAQFTFDYECREALGYYY